ncbi:MAG: serine hydrolase [Stenotrophomonas acidaminiphila]|nr:MAG: serine hydrolase [Stenotrophomonas acidaminiphila]
MSFRRIRILALLPCLAVAAMASAGEPVAQVRVAFDRNGITSTHAEGMADLATGRKITADDPVRVASISKLVTTIGVMRLVEAGMLDLDADVSTYLGWTLRHPKFPDTPITLRLLLSHRSSLTDAAGYYATPLGQPLKGILDDPKAWDDTHAPGTHFRYTNLNFPLDLLMRRLVLESLKLDACFNWEGCDAATATRAVVLYRDGAPVRDENRAGKPACAVVTEEGADCDLARWKAGDNGALFSPQGGLRISANGLTKIGRLFLGNGEVDGVRLLSSASVDAMTAPQWTFDGGNGVTHEEDTGGGQPRAFFCRYGLAVQTLATAHDGCGDDLFGDGVARVGHSGDAYALRSGLWMDRTHGTGVAYFATDAGASPPGEQSVFTRVEERLARGVAQPEDGQARPER